MSRPNARAPILSAETALVSGWQLLMSTDQTLDAIDDPGAVTDGATAFAGGVATWQTKDAGIPVFDGGRENCPGWTRSLRELYPDFSPDIDIIDLRADILACPMNTAQYGIVIGVADDTIANRATWNMAGLAIRPSSATAWGGGQIGATGLLTTSGTIGTNTNPVSQLLCRTSWHTDASPSARVAGQVSRTGLDELGLTIQGAPGPAFAADPSIWRLFVGLVHFAAVDATDNVVQARIFHKRIRTGSLE